MAPPGSPAKPIIIEGEAPVYTPGDSPGNPIDLTDGEENPTCSICQSTRRGNSRWQRVSCCGSWFHAACLQPWATLQRRQYASVACPMCRRVTVDND